MGIIECFLPLVKKIDVMQSWVLDLKEAEEAKKKVRHPGTRIEMAYVYIQVHRWKDNRSSGANYCRSDWMLSDFELSYSKI